MKIYHNKSYLQKLSKEQLQRLHRRYVLVLTLLLSMGGIGSLLAIWGYIADIWQYLLPVLLLVLWPWIMQSSYMAKKLKK